MFYTKFKELCRKKGVSCARAALDIGLSESTPTMWKRRGVTPRSEVLSRIADYFGVSVDYLLGKDQPLGEDGDDELCTTAFARNLRDLRIERGMTQQQLAERLDVNYCTVSLYESGKREPGYKKLLTISQIFNVSVDYLLKNDPEEALMKGIGVVVRYLRGALSLREFASRCGVAHTTIDNIEKGIDFRTGKPTEMTVATLSKIAKACDVRVSWILKSAEESEDDKEGEKHGRIQKCDDNA